MADSYEGRRLASERLCFGTGAAAGLVAAACLSALPSSSCAGIAEAYEIAIRDFGFMAIAAIYFGIALQTRRWRTVVFKKFAPPSFAGISIILFFVMCIGSLRNMSIVIPICFVGTPTEIAAQQHEHVPLYDWMFFERS